MQAYNKAITAALAALFTILGGFGINAAHWGSDEVIGALSTVVGAVLVYLLPNKPSQG